jgi:2'-5' RNA ligase
MIRTFFAVDISQSTRERASQAAQKMRVALQGNPTRISWVDPETMHITLRFLGSTDEKDLHRLSAIAKASVEGILPFTVRVGAVDFFPSANRPRVIFCHGESQQLPLIAKNLEERLVKSGFGETDFPHRSHITLGRIKDDRPPMGLAPLLKNLVYDEIPAFVVSEIILYQSETRAGKAVYTPIETFSLSQD